MLIGALLISIGSNCLQYHKIEIAKQQKIIYQLYIEKLCQKIQELLDKEKSRKDFKQTKYGGVTVSIGYGKLC